MRKLRPRRSFARDEAGTTALEFAVVTVVFLTLLFGIVEFGRAVWLYQAVSAASREAARYGISNESVAGTPRYLDCTGMRSAASSRAPDLTLATGDVQITYRHPNGTTGSCGAAGSVVNRTKLEVRVNKTFDVNLPLVPLGDFTISATDTRSIYNGTETP